MKDVTCNKCGSINNYRTEVSGNHLKAICKDCESYIKFLPQYNLLDLMPFGKYKDREIKSLIEDDEVKYLQWAVNNLKLSESVKFSINKHLKTL